MFQKIFFELLLYISYFAVIIKLNKSSRGFAHMDMFSYEKGTNVKH